MEREKIIHLVIYLIGYVWAYILCKRERYVHDWGAVFMAVSFSTLSWLLVFFHYFEKIKLPKPPKWL